MPKDTSYQAKTHASPKLRKLAKDMAADLTGSFGSDWGRRDVERTMHEDQEIARLDLSDTQKDKLMELTLGHWEDLDEVAP